MKEILDRLLLQHNPDALLAISENGEIPHWNDAAEAIRADCLAPADEP